MLYKNNSDILYSILDFVLQNDVQPYFTCVLRSDIHSLFVSSHQFQLHIVRFLQHNNTKKRKNQHLLCQFDQFILNSLYLKLRTSVDLHSAACSWP